MRHSGAEALNPGPMAAGRAARADRAAAALALLGGALFSQYVGGLYPCEMCYWQRWPHGAAILLAVLAFTAPSSSLRSLNLTLAAALAIAISGMIGIYHAGVEAKIFEGLTVCTKLVNDQRIDRRHAAPDQQRADRPLRPGAV